MIDFFKMPQECPKCGQYSWTVRFKKRTAHDRRVDILMAREARDLDVPPESVDALEEMAAEPTCEWLAHICRCGFKIVTKTREESNEPITFTPPDPSVSLSGK